MIFDSIFAVIVLVSAIIAFLRGLIKEVLTIFGLVGGGLFAFLFGGDLRPWARDIIAGGADSAGRLWGMIPYTLLADIAAYGGIFVAVVIILSILSHFIAGAVKSIGLGPVDRTLGFVFGIARGILLLTLLSLPADALLDDKQKQEFFAESKTLPLVDKTAQLLQASVPEGDAMKKHLPKKPEAEEDRDLSAIPPTNDPAPETKGYAKDQRDAMDSLFEERALNQ